MRCMQLARLDGVLDLTTCTAHPHAVCSERHSETPRTYTEQTMSASRRFHGLLYATLFALSGRSRQWCRRRSRTHRVCASEPAGCRWQQRTLHGAASAAQSTKRMLAEAVSQQPSLFFLDLSGAMLQHSHVYTTMRLFLSYVLTPSTCLY